MINELLPAIQSFCDDSKRGVNDREIRTQEYPNVTERELMLVDKALENITF